MTLRPHRADLLGRPPASRRLAAAAFAAIMGFFAGSPAQAEIVWQSVTVPNGDFGQSGTLASWDDGGLASLSTTNVLTGWQFAAGSNSRLVMTSGSRTADPVINGTRGQVARIAYNGTNRRKQAAGYITSEPISGVTIPTSGGRFKMEVSYLGASDNYGANFGFLYGSVTTAADVTTSWINSDASNDRWGAPYQVDSGHNTRFDSTSGTWNTVRIFWDNTGTFDETFGLTGAINTFNNGTEGYASDTVDGVTTLRYYTNKRGTGEGLRLGASARTNGGSGSLYLDDFKLWVPYETPPPPPPPTSQRWFGDDGNSGGDGTWTTTSTTWRRSPYTGDSEALEEGAIAQFPQLDGTVTIADEGVTITNGMTFEAATNYTLTGGTLTLGGATPTKNTIDVNANSITTISAPIAGTAGLNKAGPGKLILSGSGTLSGNVAVSAGTLQVSHASALGTSPVFVSGTGSTLAVNTDATLGALDIRLGGKLELDQSATYTLSVESLSLVQDDELGWSFIDIGVGRLEIASGVNATALRTALLEGLGPGNDWFGTTDPALGTKGILSSVVPFYSGQRTIGYRMTGDDSAIVAFAAPGDIDLDGKVDSLDMVSMMAARKFGTGQAAVWSEGDFNYDGFANEADLDLITYSYLFGTGNYLPLPLMTTQFSVPEPAAGPLMAVAAVGLAAACRRLRRG